MTYELILIFLPVMSEFSDIEFSFVGFDRCSVHNCEAPVIFGEAKNVPSLSKGNCPDE